MKRSSVFIFCFLCLFSFCHGQKKDKPIKKDQYQIKLNDGTTYVGELLSSDKDQMLFLSNTGDTLTFDKQNIRDFAIYKNKSSQIDELKSGDVSRYFYTSPAFTIGKNEISASTQGFSYQNIKYGFTDKFSLEMGTSFTGWVLQIPLLAVTPKYRFIDSPKFKLSAYASYLTVLPNIEDNRSNVFLFGVTSTSGNESGNISVGLSYGVVDGQFLDLPLFQLAGAKYLSTKVALIFDSQIVSFGRFIDDDIGIFYNVMPGIRLMKKEHSFDLAAAITGFNINGEGEFLIVPYVGYTVSISNIK